MNYVLRQEAKVSCDAQIKAVKRPNYKYKNESYF